MTRLRRLIPAVVLFVLTGTLLAQTPQPAPLASSGPRFTIMFRSQQQDGDKVTSKDVHVVFATGETITADEMVYDKTKGDAISLSGNVRLILKR